MFGDSMPTVLEEGAQRETGENSRMASFMGAFAICDLVKTTLGPKGMDKILQPMGGGQVQITNDGATILKSIMIDNPAAKVLVEISKVQDDEVGDGTTSVCVLAGELLKVAEDLISQKIHPQTIIAGFRQACDVAAAVRTPSHRPARGARTVPSLIVWALRALRRRWRRRACWTTAPTRRRSVRTSLTSRAPP